jgi:uncharacterized protein (TIGR03067 family)
VYSRNPIRLAFRLGILLAVIVLAGVYYLRLPPKPEQAPPVKEPQLILPTDPQVAVVRAIRARTNRPDGKVEILQWWPPRRVVMEQAERLVCRAVYKLEGPEAVEGPESSRLDGAFALEGDTARLLWGRTESIDTHHYLDQFFPCEECPFGPAAVRARQVADEYQKLAGTWVIQSVSPDRFRADDWKGIRWVLANPTVTGKLPADGPATERFTFGIVSTSDPKQVDIRVPGRREALLGVYVLDGDTLTVCWSTKGRSRPSAPGDLTSDHIQVVLQRERS